MPTATARGDEVGLAIEPCIGCVPVSSLRKQLGPLGATHRGYSMLFPSRHCHWALNASPQASRIFSKKAFPPADEFRKWREGDRMRV